MSAATIKVAVVGATGRTGSSIVDGLLASQTPKFEVTALTRPSALDSPANQALRDRGVRVVRADLAGPKPELVRVLQGIDAVVSAIIFDHMQDQIPLAEAAKEAGVGRFVPAFWGTPAPRGVMKMMDQKLDILAAIQRLHLPWTVIDVGWWSQQMVPRVPSGRTAHGAFDALAVLPGDGTVPIALTDVRDIGRYAARILADPRTLNKAVLAYTEVLTFQQIVDLLYRLSGEKAELETRSAEEIRGIIEASNKALETNPNDQAALFPLFINEYLYSWGVRGDNTPEAAAYLGYLDFKELYPDEKGKTLESIFVDVLDGKPSGFKLPSGYEIPKA